MARSGAQGKWNGAEEDRKALGSGVTEDMRGMRGMEGTGSMEISLFCILGAYKDFGRMQRRQEEWEDMRRNYVDENGISTKFYMVANTSM